MFDSLVLRTVARLMLPLLVALSIFMLLRGHNEPGGGFIGGLLAASAFILQIVASGPEFTRRIIPISYLRLASFGVLFAAIWGVPALLFGSAYMQSLWLPQAIPGIGKIGTPVLFDVGVYLAVVGITTHIALMLADEPRLFPIDRDRDSSDAQATAPE